MSSSTSRLARIAAFAGWIIAAVLAALLVMLLPRLRLRVLERPVTWDQAVAERQAALATVKWEDNRPLCVWIGDSQVEMGNWYDLFHGAYAIRNCGMTMATIADVSHLVDSIPEKNPEMVVILCGVNNLYRGEESVEASAEEYAALLKKTREHFQPHRLVVLAVMPVRQNAVDPKSAGVNHKISEFNRVLRNLCAGQGAEFIDASEAVVDADGGLDFRLTQDGLHLNAQGYKALTATLRKKLAHE